MLGAGGVSRGGQQGDPLDPILFSLVLNLVVSEITFSGVCADFSYGTIPGVVWMAGRFSEPSPLFKIY